MAFPKATVPARLRGSCAWISHEKVRSRYMRFAAEIRHIGEAGPAGLGPFVTAFREDQSISDIGMCAKVAHPDGLVRDVHDEAIDARQRPIQKPRSAKDIVGADRGIDVQP